VREGNEVWDVLETLRGHPTDTPAELVAWLNAIRKGLVAHPALV
jgi:hypothetical protein